MPKRTSAALSCARRARRGERGEREEAWRGRGGGWEGCTRVGTMARELAAAAVRPCARPVPCDSACAGCGLPACVCVCRLRPRAPQRERRRGAAAEPVRAHEAHGEHPYKSGGGLWRGSLRQPAIGVARAPLLSRGGEGRARAGCARWLRAAAACRVRACSQPSAASGCSARRCTLNRPPITDRARREGRVRRCPTTAAAFGNGTQRPRRARSKFSPAGRPLKRPAVSRGWTRRRGRRAGGGGSPSCQSWPTNTPARRRAREGGVAIQGEGEQKTLASGVELCTCGHRAQPAAAGAAAI